MRTAAQRIAHYTARMVSSLIDPVLTAMNSQQLVNFTAYAQDFTPKQEQMRAILDAAGISHSLFFLYEAMNGKFYHATKVSSGAALVAEMQLIKDEWKDRGCADATAKLIALQVYGVTLT